MATNCDCSVLAKPRMVLLHGIHRSPMDSSTHLLFVHCGNCGHAAKSAHLADSWHVCYFLKLGQDSVPVLVIVAGCNVWLRTALPTTARHKGSSGLLCEGVEPVDVMPHDIHSSSWLRMKTMLTSWI